MGRSVSGAGNSRGLNDEHAVPTIRFARPRSNSLAAIAPARVASLICANSVLLRAQSLWVLFLLPPPQPSPASGGGSAPSSCTVVLYLVCKSPLILHAAEAAHDLPFLRGYRLHGEARIFRERHLLEPWFGLDRRQRHRLRKRLHRLDVDREKHALLVGGIVVALADHLDDADDLLLLAGVIEQGVLALLHLL